MKVQINEIWKRIIKWKEKVKRGMEDNEKEDILITSWVKKEISMKKKKNMASENIYICR